MTYSETVEWMFQQLPMYQQVGGKAYKVDLSNIQKLIQRLHNPHKNFKAIHVAGTNGKGSVSHMLASVLHEAGYKVGLYTSPHLKDFRERIKINGRMIPESAVVKFIDDNKTFFEQESLSFFEMTVGMAFSHFSDEKVDIAVIEVGLGGRLDSTNIISPVLSVITNIGLDHVAILGDSLPQIAAEKGGIIKENTAVVIGEHQEETFNVFKELAEAKNAPLYLAEDFKGELFPSDLQGQYQEKNIRTVFMALQVLKDLKWNISGLSIEKGLRNVIFNTGLRGRWEVLQEKPKVICDTAHNREGLVYAMKQLQEEDFEQLHFVLGVVNDKDLTTVLPLFPKSAKYYFAMPNIPRGLPAEELQRKAAEKDLFGDVYNSVSAAYRMALTRASLKDVIYIGGSTFTVAEII